MRVKKVKEEVRVTCPYCNSPALLHTDDYVYGRNMGGYVWVCSRYPECDAYVGCHSNSPTHKPKGRLADKELRAMKIKAHAYFDPLIKYKFKHFRTPDGNTYGYNECRDMAYEWLAQELGMDKNRCHIGKFNLQECRLVIQACEKLYEANPRLKLFKEYCDSL